MLDSCCQTQKLFQFFVFWFFTPVQFVVCQAPFFGNYPFWLFCPSRLLNLSVPFSKPLRFQHLVSLWLFNRVFWDFFLILFDIIIRNLLPRFFNAILVTIRKGVHKRVLWSCRWLQTDLNVLVQKYFRNLLSFIRVCLYLSWKAQYQDGSQKFKGKASSLLPVLL